MDKKIEITKEPRKAFVIDPQQIFESIKQQFPEPWLCLRELGQNSVDAGATRIYINFKYDPALQEGIVEFEDDGCGMSRQIIHNNFLTLFWSSKEGNKKAIGQYSIGRLSMFTLFPSKIEVITVTKAEANVKAEAHCLVIKGNLRAALYEVVNPPLEKGTRVTINFPCPENEFGNRVKQAVNVVKQNLAYVAPTIRVSYTDDNKQPRTEFINKSFEEADVYKPRLLKVKLHDSAEECLVFLGLSDRITGLHFTKGRIPLEHKYAVPWMSEAIFSLDYLLLKLDSFSFQHVFSRNEVLPTEFYHRLIERLFEKVVLPYYQDIARQLIAREQLGGFDTVTCSALASLCIQAKQYHFTIPEEILQAPIIPAADGWSTYSIEQLSQLASDKRSKGEKIYYTTASAITIGYQQRRHKESLDENFLVVALGRLPWNFRYYLQARLGDALVEVQNNVLLKCVKLASVDTMNLFVRSLRESSHKGLEFGRTVDSNMASLNIAFAELQYLNGKQNTTTRSMLQEGVVYLNVSHPYIEKLVELMRSGDGKREIAAHYLLREALYTRDAKIPLRMRETWLKKDLEERFESKAYAPLSIDNTASLEI